jgi:hypothetical protein
VAEKLNTGLGFLPIARCALFVARIMGLYKGQNIITGSHMLPGADDNRQVNISRKRRHTKREE